MAVTPEEELRKLIAEYKQLTGREVKFDITSAVKLTNAIKLLKDNIQLSQTAASELADNFETTLDVLISAKKELVNIDKTIRQGLRPEFNKLGNIILGIRNNHREILNGYSSETKIQKQLNNIINVRANIEAQSRTLNNQVIFDLLEATKASQALAEEQLKILTYSKSSAKDIESFAKVLNKLPLIGKTLSSPFKELGNEIVGNTTKLQALNLEINSLKDQSKVIFDLIKQDKRFTLVKEGNVIGLRNIANGMKGVSKETKDLVKEYANLIEAIRESEAELNALPSRTALIIKKLNEVFSITRMAEAVLVKFFEGLGDAFKQIDEQSTQLARTLSITRDKALELRASFNDTARLSYLTTEELSKSQLQYVKLTGNAVQLNEENLISLAQAVEYTKLSEEAQRGLINAASTTGKTYDEIQHIVLGTSTQTQFQNGLIMDQKEILEEVLTTSASMRIQFGNSTEELTKAVVEAKRLGFSLKDIEGIQQNLLNFESSIGAELEAELLTGRDLRLEKARYFALQGDIANLTKEINANGVTALEYENMNVLQRESFAKALGMSADRMSEILLTQQQNDNIAASLLGKEALINKMKAANLDLSVKGFSQAILTGKLTKDELNALGETEKGLINSLTVTEKFNRTIESIKESFVNMVDGPVGGFIKKLEGVLDYLNNSPMLSSILGMGMIGGVVISAGVMAAAMVQMATRGSIGNPMYVIDVMKAGVTGAVGKMGAIGKGALGASAGMAGFGITNAITDNGSTASYLGNMASGALTGASLGSMIGPWGTLAGGIIGGAGGLLYADSETPLASGGIVTGPTRALVGEAGHEAVIPLDAFYAKLDQLIDAVDKVTSATKEEKNLVVDGATFARVSAQANQRFSFK